MAGLARQATSLQRKLSLEGQDGQPAATDTSPKSTQLLFQKIEASTSAPIGTEGARSDAEYIPPPVGFLPHAASMPVQRSFMTRNTSLPAARSEWPSFGTSYTTSTDAESASASLSPTRFSFFSRRPFRSSTSARNSASRGPSMDDSPDTSDCCAHTQPIPIAHQTLAHRDEMPETAPDDIAMYDAADRREDELKASFHEWQCAFSASSL